MTTIIIVFIVFKRLDLAIAAGIFESISKILIYFVHERFWNKVRFGKKRIEPFVLWFTGVPLAGKTTVADHVFKGLQKYGVPLERIDSKEIRELIPDVGFEREDRIRHLKRVGHLVKTLQNNSISVVASFISPYEVARTDLRKRTENYVEVFVKASMETCQKRDKQGIYGKALNGDVQNFTGVSDVYDEPKNPEIVLDMDVLSLEEAVEVVLKYMQKNVMNELNGN